MGSFGDWFGEVALGYYQRAERRFVPGLAAHHANGRKTEPDRVKNISATGIYIETRAKWPPKGMVSLWLHKSGPTADPFADRIAIRAEVVRRDDDHAALSFVLPKGMYLSLWHSPLMTSPVDNGLDSLLREFRLSATIVFLSKICPEEEETICKLLRHELSNYRVINILDIVQRAESLLGPKIHSTKRRMNPKLLLKIIDEGSWAGDEWRRRLWAGLLVSSRWARIGDIAYETLVNAMSQLTVVHSKLLLFACRKTTKVVTENGVVFAIPFSCTTDEIVTLLGTHDLHRIDCDLEHLALQGLFVQREKTRFFVALDDTSMTPSGLGLELYARSCGHLGSVAEFYGAAPEEPDPDEPVEEEEPIK